MQVDFRPTNTDLSGALTYHIRRRLKFALGRHAGNLDRVSATVSGTAGRDVHCELSASVKPFGRLAAEASAPDLMTAVDLAIGKLKRLAERSHQRFQDHRQAARLAA